MPGSNVKCSEMWIQVSSCVSGETISYARSYYYFILEKGPAMNLPPKIREEDDGQELTPEVSAWLCKGFSSKEYVWECED